MMAEAFVKWISEAFMVCLIYVAVKEYRKKDISIRNVVWAASGAFLCTCFTFLLSDFPRVMDGIVWLSFLLLPGLVLFNVSKKIRQPMNERKLLKWWLLCDGVIWLWYLFDMTYLWRYFYYWVWEPMLLICLPMVCAAIYGRSKRYPAVRYFSACLLIRILTDTVLGMIHDMATSIVTSIYYIVICLIVYGLERQYKREKSERGMVAILAVGLYVGISGLILFWQNTRVREIFYYLGGGSFYIDVANRENWIEYRLEVLGDANLEKVLIGYTILVICLVICLLKKTHANSRMYHGAKLLAISYLARTGMFILAVLGGFSYIHIMDMPFTTYFGMDAVVLGLFFWEHKKE